MTTIDSTREFVAETQEAALEKALTHFGVARDKLEIRIVPPELEISGLAGRALLLVSIKGAEGAAPSRAPRSDRGDRGGDRGGRGRRDEGRRESRGDGRRDRGRDRGERGDRSERGERRPAPPREPVGPLNIEHGPLGEVGEFVEHVVRAIAQGGNIRIEESEVDGEVRVVVSGDGADDMAARAHGLGAAISHLAQRAAENLVSEDTRVDVTVGSGRGERGGDRGDRGGERGERGERGGEREDVDEVRLEALAREAAEEVRSSGEPKLLAAMTSRERFIVHNLIRDLPGVTSESVSEGRERRIEVRPE